MDSENLQKNTVSFETVFLKEIHDLEILFNENLSKEKLNLYFEILKKNLNQKDFLYASDFLKKNYRQEYGNKFPLPANFLDIIKERDKKLNPPPEEDFDRFYQELQEAVPKGMASYVGDEEFRAIVKTQGGNFNLSRWSDNDWKYNRGRLKDSYVAKINHKTRESEFSGNRIAGKEFLKFLVDQRN